MKTELILSAKQNEKLPNAVKWLNGQALAAIRIIKQEPYKSDFDGSNLVQATIDFKDPCDLFKLGRVIDKIEFAEFYDPANQSASKAVEDIREQARRKVG